MLMQPTNSLPSLESLEEHIEWLHLIDKWTALWELVENQIKQITQE